MKTVVSDVFFVWNGFPIESNAKNKIRIAQKPKVFGVHKIADFGIPEISFPWRAGNGVSVHAENAGAKTAAKIRRQ